MKRLLLLGVCTIAIGAVGPASAQSVPERTGINSTLGIAPKTADFVKEVAISDMFEIESSKLAQEKGNGATKSFAEHMVMDHTKTSGELKNIVASGKAKVEIPAALDSAHQGKLDKLKGLDGADFTKQY